jgi:hypothetical protein
MEGADMEKKTVVYSPLYTEAECAHGACTCGARVPEEHEGYAGLGLAYVACECGNLGPACIAAGHVTEVAMVAMVAAVEAEEEELGAVRYAAY